MDNTILIFAIILLALILFFSIMKHKYIQSEKENMGALKEFIIVCGKAAGNAVKEIGKSFIGKKIKKELVEITTEEDRLPSDVLRQCGKEGQPPCGGAGASGGGVAGPGVEPLGPDELEMPPFRWQRGIFDIGYPGSGPFGQLKPTN